MPPEPRFFLTRRTALLGAVAAAPLGVAVTLPRLLGQSRTAVQEEGGLTPEMFGARGDGSTNDTAAFARLAAAVNSVGGGLISFGAGKTYIVGEQRLSSEPRARFAFEPAEILVLRGCTRPLTIRGNGATLKCAPGLRYGTFDRSGRRTENPMPYAGRGELASPYRHMIHIENCSGPIEVSDLELDGNVGALVIGGPYGDKGRQIQAYGLALTDNEGSETLRNIHSHHHALDGLLIDGLSEAVPGAVRRVTAVNSEYNGRQGCSIVGGRGYRFENCRFNHTGRAGLYSAPGAGLDIEAEGGKTNRDLHFLDCEFADNRGAGMGAATGDSEGAVFERCKFVGTSNFAVWPRKPRFRFRHCTFVGPVAHAYADQDPERATQFHSCLFTDNPRLSPTGKVHVPGGANAIVNLGSGDLNVLFSAGRFECVGELVLPWTRRAIYADCVMRQASPKRALPRGTYLGTNSITGNVVLRGSKVLGTVIVNGVPYTGG